MKKNEKLKMPRAINLNEKLNKTIIDTGAQTRVASLKANALAGTVISNGGTFGSSGKYICTYQGYNSGSGCMYWRCVDNDNPGHMVVAVAYCGNGWSAWYLD